MTENERVAKGPPPLDSIHEFNHDRCRIHDRASAKTGPCNVRRVENLRWRNTWETKGVSAGSMLVPYHIN